MTHINIIAHTINVYRDIAIRLAIGLLVLMTITYGFLIIATTVNGARIERMEHAMSEDSSRLSDLDAVYMSIKRTLSIEEAYAMGFVEVSSPVYLTQSKSASYVAVRH